MTNLRIIGLLLSAVTITLVIAFASRGSDPAARQSQKNSDAPAKVFLNADHIGTTAYTSLLTNRLEEVFASRLEQRAFKRGLERRTDLPMNERVERTVLVTADRSINLAEVAKVIEAIQRGGAAPILMPITVQAARAKSIKLNSVRLCSTCALAKDGEAEGDALPNPLTLLVKLAPPNWIPPPAISASANDIPPVRRTNSNQANARHGSSVTWIDSLMISDGIPVDISTGVAAATTISIAKNGEFILGKRRVDPTTLEKEIRDAIQSMPANEKPVAISYGADASYASLEDIYYAAYAADATRIGLQKILE